MQPQFSCPPGRSPEAQWAAKPNRAREGGVRGRCLSNLRLRLRSSRMARRHSKMVNVASRIPFNIHNREIPPEKSQSVSRSASRSSNEIYMQRRSNVHTSHGQQRNRPSYHPDYPYSDPHTSHSSISLGPEAGPSSGTQSLTLEQPRPMPILNVRLVGYADAKNRGRAKERGPQPTGLPSPGVGSPGTFGGTPLGDGESTPTAIQPTVSVSFAIPCFAHSFACLCSLRNTLSNSRIQGRSQWVGMTEARSIAPPLPCAGHLIPTRVDGFGLYQSHNPTFAIFPNITFHHQRDPYTTELPSRYLHPTSSYPPPSPFVAPILGRLLLGLATVARPSRSHSTAAFLPLMTLRRPFTTHEYIARHILQYILWLRTPICSTLFLC